MCDYSMTHVKNRPAREGDRLEVYNFGAGTAGFAAPLVRRWYHRYIAPGVMHEPRRKAVCCKPGTELVFDAPISALYMQGWIYHTAIFRQFNMDTPRVAHDALELPDGTRVFLTNLQRGQMATVLQLPRDEPIALDAVRQPSGVFELSSS